MLFGKIQFEWPTKLIAMLLIMQVMALGQLSFAQANFAPNTRPTTTSLSAPCPKVEVQTKATQNQCQNYLNISLNSIVTNLALFVSSNASFRLFDKTMHYKLLVYSIFKPPKKLFLH